MTEKKPAAYVPPHLRQAGVASRPAEDSASEKLQPSNKTPRNRGIQFGPRPHSNFQHNSSNTYIPHSHSMPEVDITDDQIEQLFQSSTSTADISAYDNSVVKISGSEISPIAQFPGSGIDNEILVSVAEMGFKVPTPVQKFAIPAILGGLDLIVTSQTGSGKTAAFMLPVLTNVLTRNEAKHAHNPVVVCLVPVRELAQQELEQTEHFCSRSNLKVVCIYGGAPMNKQISYLRYGVDILIATPGRLIDFFDRGLISMSNVHYLILDECDKMLDMGFEPQIWQIIKAMDMPPNEQRQNLLFSATFPRAVQQLAQQFMRPNPCRIEVGLQDAPSLIKQRFLYVPALNKMQALLETIKEVPGQTVVFAERKIFVDEIENYLFEQNLPVVAIHGGRDMRDRRDALDLFTTGRATIMVATDVAARGLDIPNVAHVINLDLPTDLDSYTHRIGRTGRAGHKGTATSFWNEANAPLLQQLLVHIRQTRQPIPEGLEEFQHQYEKPAGGGGGGYSGRKGGGGYSGRGGGFRNSRSYNNMQKRY